MERTDCWLGLQKAYPIAFKDVIALDGAPRYLALMNKESDVIDAYSTDGLLKKYDLLNENTLLVHCNYLNENDIKLIKDNSVSVAVCHSSNLKLNNKPCNIKKLLDNGINVMVATDGPATNDSLSLLDSLKVTALLSGINSSKLLDLITVNPAQYMKINSGSIVEGNKADILLYNKNSLNITYTQSAVENLIYTSGNKPEIIIKDGKVIIENYKFKDKIENNIINEKNKIINLLENNKFNN